MLLLLSTGKLGDDDFRHSTVSLTSNRYYQSDLSIIDSVTTSQLNIATLVPMDVTAEVAWHMRGLIRNGGTEEQLRFAFDTTIEVCEITNIRLKNEMPNPEDVINQERLF